MEAAATPLRPAAVRLVGERLLVDGLVVSDPGSVALLRTRTQAGEDPARVFEDALAIGARVLDREQAGAHAEYVRAEFEKASRELEHTFGERARVVAEQFSGKVDEAFSPEHGHVTRALERHFSDASSTAVQHRVRAVVDELMARSREDLLRQFSTADGRNPLADFKHASLSAMRDASRRQDDRLRDLLDKLGRLEVELQALRDERQKRLELEVERERGTAKGRTFEEGVHEALDAIALAQGDDCDAVGDLKGTTRRTGDVLVAIEACRGPARGRIVFEAKSGRLSKPAALAELDRALIERDADYAVLVVPSDDKLPARLTPLREINGDKLVVVYDPEERSRLTLEVAYALARARVLMGRAQDDELDTGALRDTIERALGAMDDVRKVKQQLTGAQTGLEKAREILDGMAARVRGHLQEVDGLLVRAGDADPGLSDADPGLSDADPA